MLGLQAAIPLPLASNAPTNHKFWMSTSLVDLKVWNLQDNSNFDDVSASYMVDIREPSPLQDVIPDETNIANSGEASNQSIELARSTRSDRSAQSDGELDRSFKFGGRPKNPSPPSTDRELTLSDIIPPAECARAISEASLRSSEF